MNKLIGLGLILAAAFLTLGCQPSSGPGPADGRYADHDGSRSNFAAVGEFI